MISAFSNNFPLKEIEIGSLRVYYEEDYKHVLTYFSKSQAKTFVAFLHKAQLEPKKYLNAVFQMKQEHPLNPLVDNLLAFVYINTKQIKKAETLIEESYYHHPQYLFARINYADQCLRKKNLTKIPTIFPSFDLKTLFPDRTRFHVSEYRGLMVLACRYYRQTKQKDLARTFYEKAYKVDPAHPSVISLEKKSILSPLKSLLNLSRP